MLREDFDSVYTDNFKCVATYEDHMGYRWRGLILDGRHTSLNGNDFVHIDSFTNSIVLERIVSISVTPYKWC